MILDAAFAEKIHYAEASDTIVLAAASKGYYKGKSETFKGFGFIDELLAFNAMSLVFARAFRA